MHRGDSIFSTPGWPGRLMVFALGLILGQAASNTLRAAGMTAAEERGKEIYFKGTSPSGGTVTAVLANSDIRMPGAVFACVNCHRHDGRGNEEGTVIPSNLTWASLIRPYQAEGENGRKHYPYDERLIKRAVTMGIDAGGVTLATEMPRFQISQADMADLLAYLKRLGTDTDPGVSQDAIRLGVLPAQGIGASEVNAAIKTTLADYFERINREGGIFNRQVALVFAAPEKAPMERTAAIRSFIQENNIFALVGSFAGDGEPEVFKTLKDLGVPVIGPLGLGPVETSANGGTVFYLDSGPIGQARALVSFAANQPYLRHQSAAVLISGGGNYATLGEVLRQECLRAGWVDAAVFVIDDDGTNIPGVVTRLISEKRGTLFFAGPADKEKAVLMHAEESQWQAALFALGSVPGRTFSGFPDHFESHVFLSYPVQSSQISSEKLAEFKAFAGTHQFGTAAFAPAMSALAAAKLLVAGLSQCGRETSRAKLVECLEQVNRLETGLLPPLSYGINRRVGVEGADVFAVDFQAHKMVRVAAALQPGRAQP